MVVLSRVIDHSFSRLCKRVPTPIRSNKDAASIHRLVSLLLDLNNNRVESERMMSFLVSLLQFGTWKAYNAKLRIFFEYCHNAKVALVSAALDAIYDFAGFLMEQRTIQAATAQPYVLEMNDRYELFGFPSLAQDNPLFRRL